LTYGPHFVAGCARGGVGGHHELGGGAGTGVHDLVPYFATAPARRNWQSWLAGREGRGLGLICFVANFTTGCARWVGCHPRIE
jgi:hypothetical protein